MSVPILHIFDEPDYQAQVERISRIVRDGGVVVLPTETVYGGAVLVSSEKARQRLADLRGGDRTRPFVVHLSKPADAAALLGPMSDLAGRLTRKLWPGPVALIFDVPAERRREVAAKAGVEEATLFDQGTIILRCPDHPVAIDVLAMVEGPVVLTALPDAHQVDLDADEHSGALEGSVDLIVDAGPTKYSKPSTMLRVKENGYEIVRQGVYDERIIERLLRTTILFVCSGNTCRSPMAEALTRQMLSKQLSVSEPELEKKGISVMSAGSYALPGARATPQAVAALRELGADLTHHRSRPLTVELIHQADLIFTMSRNHAQQVTALVPSASDKVATLDPTGDIEDPIGGDVQLYQGLAGQLQGLIQARLQETLNKY